MNEHIKLIKKGFNIENFFKNRFSNPEPLLHPIIKTITIYCAFNIL